MPGYACSGCGRKYDLPTDRIADLIRRGRTSCNMCGSDLVFPDAALAGLASAGDPTDPEGLVRYTCDACGRMWVTSPADLRRRRRRGCRSCGATLRARTLAVADALASTAPAVPAGARLQCLLCGRMTWIEAAAPDATFQCRFCGTAQRLPARPGGPGRGPALAEPAASPAMVTDLCGRSGRRGEPMRFFEEVLVARAGLEDLGAAEARDLVARLDAVSRWRPRRGEANWPLPLSDAERAVPPVLFPGKPHHVERGPDGSDVVFVVGTSDAKGSTGARIVNTIGLATLVFGGAGLFLVEGEPAAGDQRRIRIALRPRDGGGVSLALFTQHNDDPPRAVGGKAEHAFGELVSGQRPALVAYCGILAVFGGWASAAGIAAATVPAIADRLAALGLGGRAALWAPRLSLARVTAS